MTDNRKRVPSRVAFLLMGAILGGAIGFVLFGAASWAFSVAGLLSQARAIDNTVMAAVCFSILGLFLAYQILTRRRQE